MPSPKPYPLVFPLTVPNVPAPEVLLPERTEEVDYSVNENPMPSLQPGYDLPGVRLFPQAR